MSYKIIKITKKQFELLKFIKEEMPFGECKLISHNGQPERVEQINKKKIFGLPVENLENKTKNEDA